MEHTSSFGAELRARRQAAGLTLAELAALVHYSSSQLSKIENGRSPANRTLADRCEAVFSAGGALVAALEDAGLDTPRPPSDLPRDITTFTGRAAELDTVLSVLGDQVPGEPGIVVVCVISGMGGVGKTALALRAAHRLEAAFPDGRLFIDLHGFSETAMVSAGDALGRLLRRLDVPMETIPTDQDERAALFRDQLRGKRVLLLLDNALDVAHVLPLLPGTSGCCVLITSRDQFGALDDAHHISLEPLSPSDSEDLVRKLVAAGPASARGMDQVNARRIASWCQGLPLAIRIASARFRNAPWPEVPALDEGSEPDFDDRERDLASVFESSVLRLPSEAADLFTLLGLHPGANIGLPAAAALTNTDLTTVRRWLQTLLDTNLLLASEQPGRYTLHDLLRTFARGRADSVLSPTDRHEALRRMAGYYLDTLDSADRILTPYRHRLGMEPRKPKVDCEFGGYGRALAWVFQERDNLAAVCRATFTAGLDEICWQIAFAFRGFLFIAKDWDQWIETHRLALAATVRAGHMRAEAVTRNNLGLALLEHGDHAAAAAMYDDARSLFARLGDAYGEHLTLAHHAWVRFHSGEFREALQESTTALEFVARVGSPRNKAILLRDTALIEIELGLHRNATVRLSAALETFTVLELHVDAAMAYNSLGEAHYRLSSLDEAREAFLRGAESGRSSGSIFEEARAHEGLGTIAAELADEETARFHWDQALTGYTSLRDRRRAEAMRSLLAGARPQPGLTSE